MQKNAYKKKRTRQGVFEFVFGNKPLILTLSFIFSAVMVICSTMAWFISDDSVINTVKREDLVNFFSVVEVDDFDKEPDPSGNYHKSVGAQNIGTKPGFVRLTVLPVFFVPGENGDLPTLLPAEFEKHIIIDDFNLWDINADPSNSAGADWVYGEDGYYYYLHRIDPGESTYTLTNTVSGENQNLFNTLHIANNLPEEYEGAELRIEVKLEAAGVDNYREGWWGVPNNTAPTFPAIIVTIDSKLKAVIS